METIEELVNSIFEDDKKLSDQVSELSKEEQRQKDIVAALQATKKTIHKATEPDLGEQYKNVLVNTKDKVVDYVADTVPKVGKAISDTGKDVGNYVVDTAPKVGKSILDTTRKAGDFITNKSKEYFPGSSAGSIGTHLGNNLGVYGGIAAAGLGAYGVQKYLKRRREKKGLV